VFVHGGNWVSGAKSNYRFVADTLTASGFVVVIPNYRLYPDAKFPSFVDDVAAAVAWTHAHAKDFGGDPNRLFLMGHSAGAHIAALLALDTPYLSRAGADRAWINGWIGLAGPYDFLPFDAEYLRDMFGPLANYPASQPINFVDAKSPPALLIHGEADTVVLPRNSRSLAAQLRGNGVEVRERYYEDMSHAEAIAALSVYLRSRRDVLHEIEDFVRRRALVRAASDSAEAHTPQAATAN
jgi:acetyl esterase/lipase